MFVVGMAAIVLGYVVVYYGVQLMFRQIILNQGASDSVWGVPFSMLLGITPSSTDITGKRPSAPFNFANSSSGAKPASDQLAPPSQPSGGVQTV